MKNKDLIVRLVDYKNFELQEDFYFYFAEDVDLCGFGYPSLEEKMRYVIVPKGFSTDFGSVPQLFQGLVSPIGNATKAYVLHDFLCVMAHDRRLSRKEADRIFKAALKQLKINAVLSSVLYGAVRTYAILRGLK